MRLSLRLCGAFMLAACGSGGPRADEPEALEGDEVAEEVILEDGQVLIGALSAEPAPDAQPRPAPVVVRRGPADRAPAGSRSNEPALAEAERLHALALSTQLDETEPSATVQDAVAALDARFEAATRATDAALEAYAALAEEAQLAPIANTRAGDLLDAMAARFAATRLHLPEDLRGQIAHASADVREAVRDAFFERVAELLMSRAEPWFCRAAQHYRAANSDRADDQLSRYGESFITRCEAR